MLPALAHWVATNLKEPTRHPTQFRRTFRAHPVVEASRIRRVADPCSVLLRKRSARSILSNPGTRTNLEWPLRLHVAGWRLTALWDSNRGFAIYGPCPLAARRWAHDWRLPRRRSL